MTKPNPETLAKLRVRIAQLSGWTLEVGPHFKILCPPESKEFGFAMGLHMKESECWDAGLHGDENGHYKLPDYPEDLNAVHEASKQCLDSADLRVRYLVKLDVICGDSFYESKSNWSPNPCFAEAWQRCIAIDRVLSETPIV